MKKRICGFLKPKSACVLLSLCALFFLFPSCNDDDGRGGGKQGFLSLKVSSDIEYKPATRADYTDPEDTGEYLIEIVQGDEVVESFLYAEAPDELPLETGTYQVRATWGTHVPAAFEALYMEGTKTFSVEENEVTSVTIEPAPANALVIVNYSDELIEYYPAGYHVEMSTQYTSEPFLYGQDETRPAYFMGGADEKMDLEMYFSTEKTDYVFTDSFLFSPRDSMVVKISLEDEGEVIPNPTLTLSPSFYQFTAETTQAITIRVTTNCDAFTYTSSGSWFSVSKGNGTLIVTPRQNTTSSARSGYITVTAMKGNKSISAQVSLVQLNTQTGEAEKPYIFANPNMLQGDMFTDQVVNIQTNGSSWNSTIIDGTDWLTAIPQSNTLLISSNSKNNGETDRTAQIALSTTLNGSTARDTITVTQIITVENPELSIWLNGSQVSEIPFNSDGGTQTILVNTNLAEWDVIIPESATSWLRLTDITENSFGLSAEGISSEESREVVITIEAKAKNGQVVLRNFPTVIQNGKGKPKLKVTIEVDNTILVETVLTGYVLDNPLSADPSLYCSGFESIKTITIRKEQARSYFINVRTPQKINTCSLKSFPGGEMLYDWLDSGNGSGAVCSMNNAGTLGIIYLDEFFNSLQPGSHQFTLEVTDESASSTPATVLIFINVEN